MVLQEVLRNATGKFGFFVSTYMPQTVSAFDGFRRKSVKIMNKIEELFKVFILLRKRLKM